MTLTRCDYEILITLYNKECTNEIKAYAVRGIKKHTNLSMSTIRKALKNFIKLELVTNGAMDANAKTYYITKKGIDKIKKLVN